MSAQPASQGHPHPHPHPDLHLHSRHAQPPRGQRSAAAVTARRSWLQAGAGWRLAAVAAMLAALALVVHGSLAR